MAAMSTEVFVDVHTDNKMQPAVSSVETPRPMAPNATMLYKAMNIDANAPLALQRPDMDFFEVWPQPQRLIVEAIHVDRS